MYLCRDKPHKIELSPFSKEARQVCLWRSPGTLAGSVDTRFRQVAGASLDSGLPPSQQPDRSTAAGIVPITTRHLNDTENKQRSENNRLLARTGLPEASILRYTGSRWLITALRIATPPPDGILVPRHLSSPFASGEGQCSWPRRRSLCPFVPHSPDPPREKVVHRHGLEKMHHL